MSWTYYWASGGHDVQPMYHQFQHKGFRVGCGPVTWTMLFCWADRQAANGSAYWGSRWGLYRSNGGKGSDDVAPLDQAAGVENVIKEIHDHVDTFNLAGNGATLPQKMYKAKKYFTGRTGTRLVTHYNGAGVPETRLREYARDSIRDRATPAIIGTGWLNHYPMAYGYAWQKRIIMRSVLGFEWTETVYDRDFYVNQGWGGGGNGWVTASTWFAGEIYP